MENQSVVTVAMVMAMMVGCVLGDASGSKLLNEFSWQDYSVLVGMLVISCCIGLFYGFFSKKQTSSDDFLLGGSSMGTAPMAMSLATSFITAIELLGNPAEMYQHGSQYWLICLAFIFVMPITSNFYLPVFMKLRLTSCFQYLELRFSKSVRIVASALYIFQMVLYTSVAVYAPALALSNVTGLNTYIAVSLVYVVCIFYASQGGMKAVIMTDTFQTAVLVGSLLLVLVFGESMVGGPAVIWSHSYNTDRLELFNMDPDPTVRHSFWSVVIGGTFYWTAMFCANQASIQKYLSVQKISQARSALWFSSICLIFVYTVNFYTGMIMTAHYRDCDPIKSGIISASDQLLPLYVLNVMGHMKGVPGFFVAGVFAASLGTVAAALTSISAAVCQDFIISAFNITLPDSKGATVAKWISLVAGLISFCLVFVVERLGSVLQVALSFNGMVGGITLGLFTLGMFFPKANSKGAVIGSIVGMILVLWIGIGAQIAIARGDIVEESKPVSTINCSNYNHTEYDDNQEFSALKEEVFFLYRISYLWYSAIGCVVTVVLGWIVSMFTYSKESLAVDVDLLSPPIVRMIERLPSIMKINFGSKGKHTFEINGNSDAVRTISSTLKTNEEELSGNINCTFSIDDENRT
ncbi:sodium-coupled monocarboxylate transporter 2 [Arctopsyche grandis]|uniref:sodium-coupled monocarboxylate transporter 2 n=1 Tax=Arctopsyche grandis TaxID=121162 RepID=UPI00406D7CF3